MSTMLRDNTPTRRTRGTDKPYLPSLQDAVIAESILNRIVAGAEIIALNGPNMRRHLATATP